jgi:predicted AAA+ superfamily ATPase
VRSDPRAFLEELRPSVIFDEIQNDPELLDRVRTLIDAKPRRMGQWLFTLSQEAPLMQGITGSMAGRVAIPPLVPFEPQAQAVGGNSPATRWKGVWQRGGDSPFYD